MSTRESVQSSIAVGRNKRVIFVPGLCCRADIWEHAKGMLPEFDAITLEWPWPEQIHDYNEGANWLKAQIEQYRPEFVVAHSFGGIIALHHRSTLLQEPDWSLVVVEAFLVTPDPFFRNHVWLPSPELETRVKGMLAVEKERFPILRQVATADDPPEWRTQVLSVRASYIYGGRSGEYSADEISELAGIPKNSGHPVSIVNQASHFLMLEQPASFYLAIRESLSGQTGGHSLAQ